MTRDEALKIAKRIMDRIEQDRAIHLDAMADEIVAGMAIAQGLEKADHMQRFVDQVMEANAGEVSKAVHNLAIYGIAPRWFGIDHAVSDGDRTVTGIWNGGTFTSVGISSEIKGHKADMLIVDDVMMGRLGDAPVKREGRPPKAATGSRISREVAMINGWSNEALEEAGYVLDTWSNYWIHPRGLGDPPRWDSAKSKQRYSRAEAKRNGWSYIQMLDAGYKPEAHGGDWIVNAD